MSVHLTAQYDPV